MVLRKSAWWDPSISAHNRSLPANSDHWCFYERAKPVLFLHTGAHEQYHQPADEADLIDTDGMVRVGELAAALLLDLAFRSAPLTFVGTPPGSGR